MCRFHCITHLTPASFDVGSDTVRPISTAAGLDWLVSVAVSGILVAETGAQNTGVRDCDFVYWGDQYFFCVKVGGTSDTTYRHNWY
jgi:hypothetical protein